METVRSEERMQKVISAQMAELDTRRRIRAPEDLVPVIERLCAKVEDMTLKQAQLEQRCQEQEVALTEARSKVDTMQTREIESSTDVEEPDWTTQVTDQG
jgi:hypothetical protein